MIFTARPYKVLYFGLIFAIVIVAVVTVDYYRPYARSVMAQKDERTLVIDPGHGGEDGGALSIDGTKESLINLDIALKTAALCDFTGCSYVMTRDSEEIVYSEGNSIAGRKRFDQKSRVELTETTNNAVLMSIHQNCYPHPAPFGPQVFFSKTEGSEELAVILQTNINKALCPDNRRLASAASKDIYIMKKVSCPAVLVECGFISNPKEAELLSTDTYRLSIAFTIVGSYLGWGRQSV